ncbi:MAG: cation-translocating P-type ATPase, partial [Planctomycetaceae bacterium]
GATPQLLRPASGPLAADPGPARAALSRETIARHQGLWQTLETAHHCHHARLLAPTAENPAWRVLGDPTEGALLVAGLKAGLEQQLPPGRVVYELPFDSTRKAMSLVHRTPDGGLLMLTKGAPEMLLPLCSQLVTAQGLSPLDDTGRRQILAAAATMAGQALRVLALARRSCPDQPFETLAEEQLTFCGLAGLIDPARREAAEAVARCRSAGIRPVMITGDHPVTATAIARDLAIAGPDDQTLDGAQLDRLSDEQLVEQVVRTPVYARVSPVHKLRVVKAWRARGQIVAMTGDGVNDAPAVQAADIGVAMGITGTDVTKAASDMVLTDDNFASIVAAVEEGRGLFANIRKFIHFLLACNTGEVLLMFLAALLGWPAPLQPIHLLWINLVTDGLPALALALEPPERDLMRQPPRPPAEPVISRRDGLRIFGHGLLQAVICLLGFWWVGGPTATGADSRRAESVVFASAALCQLSMALASRSPTRTTPQLGWLTNRPLLAAVACSALLQVVVMHIPRLDRLLKTSPPTVTDWLLIFLLALLPVTVMEVSKLIAQAWRGFARSGEPHAASTT